MRRRNLGVSQVSIRPAIAPDHAAVLALADRLPAFGPTTRPASEIADRERAVLATALSRLLVAPQSWSPNNHRAALSASSCWSRAVIISRMKRTAMWQFWQSPERQKGKVSAGPYCRRVRIGHEPTGTRS